MFFEWLCIATVVLPVTVGYCYCHRQKMKQLIETDDKRLSHLLEMERIAQRERLQLDAEHDSEADRVQRKLVASGR